MTPDTGRRPKSGAHGAKTNLTPDSATLDPGYIDEPTRHRSDVAWMARIAKEARAFKNPILSCTPVFPGVIAAGCYAGSAD